MLKNNLTVTDDGSHSVFSEKFNALYHSSHGAIQESVHVFIKSGLEHLSRSKVRILEMGFGTGLNALLTLIKTQTDGLQIEYETVEAYPLDLDQVVALNYLDQLEVPNMKADFLSLHKAKSRETISLGHFQFTKHLVKLEEATFIRKFDLVYYDAFAPQTQEELWTPEIFKHLSQFLNPGAVLVSYCAKGSFKRALQAAKFSIEKIPGPPGKREMIRATFRT